MAFQSLREITKSNTVDPRWPPIGNYDISLTSCDVMSTPCRSQRKHSWTKFLNILLTLQVSFSLLYCPTTATEDQRLAQSRQAEGCLLTAADYFLKTEGIFQSPGSQKQELRVIFNCMKTCPAVRVILHSWKYKKIETNWPSLWLCACRSKLRTKIWFFSPWGSNLYFQIN